jgi:hypothetical protein
MKQMKYSDFLGFNKVFFVLNLFFLIILSNFSYSQSGCINATPFCTGTTYTYPNSTNITDLGPVDCLSSTPNTSWYFMEIDQSGPMTFDISQTNISGTGSDVDFIIWGPFTSLSSACSGANPFPSGVAVDCSYSPASVETASIPNAQVGEIYVALLTNYANEQGNITFSQTGGTGSANCPFTCGVTLNATPTACSSNTYTLNGTLSISGGPGISTPNSGTVTISSSCGGSPQVFNITGPTSNFN